MRQIITKTLSLDRSLGIFIKNVEKVLNEEIFSIERVVKIYGSNSNSYFLRTISRTGKKKKYFLKFGRQGSISQELSGNQLLSNNIPIPEIIASSKCVFAPDWILFKSIQGRLLSEVALEVEKKGESNHDLLFSLENKKEILLSKLFVTGAKKTINFRQYKQLNTNQLFDKRINGRRYKDFYGKNTKLFSYFHKKIIVNNKELPNTLASVFLSIQNKLTTPNSLIIPTYVGHGDAHQGNVMIEKGEQIWFIDNEYAGYNSAFVELSKPYYNDFIGTLFFHYESLLKRYFKILKVEESSDSIKLSIDVVSKMKLRIELTNIKIFHRKEILATSKDYLTLNDYLFMCHTLTKNPNNYSDFTKYLFLVFCLILSDFDPLNPESIYNYF